MWNRKKDDEPAERPAAGAGAGAAGAREGIPTSPYGSARPETPVARAAAVIGKTVVVTGKITGREDLVVDGRVEGDIELPENRLTVGPGGQIQGGIRAREIVVHGIVNGNLQAADRAEIKRNAKVTGDLKASRPVIEDDAYFKGNVETIRVETPKQAARQQQPPLVTEASSGAAAGAGVETPRH